MKRRAKVLATTPELLTQFLRYPARFDVKVVENPLPADARIIDCRLLSNTPTGAIIALAIESETYPEVDYPAGMTWAPEPKFLRYGDVLRTTGTS